MKSTNAQLEVDELIDKGEAGNFYKVKVSLELNVEDFEILREITRWMNGRAVLEGVPLSDEADMVMSLLTENLHRYKEMKDGKPFVLRKDRKPKGPNKA